MPRVSVIIPFLNAEAFLAAAVNSVRAQEFRDWELLLVNDGSTDGSGAIAREFVASEPDRIRCLEHDGGANRGTCASRNLGVSRARGDLVAFLDADDVWLPGKLHDQVRLIDADDAIDMIFGTPLYRHEATDGGDPHDDVPSHGIDLDRVHPPGTLSTKLHPLGPGAGPCPSDILMRRASVSAIGGFEEEFQGALQFFEDQAFFAKVFLHLSCYASGATWIHYRVHPMSISARVRAAQRDTAVRVYFLNWLENHLWELPGVDHIRAAVADAQVAARCDLLDALPDLRCDGGAVATLWFGHVDGHAMCIDVLAASDRRHRHDIQLNIPAMAVREGISYRIAFDIRASGAGTVDVGFARQGGDWSGLGLYRVVTVEGGHWAGHDLGFVANADADRTRIHVDAGQSPLRIEIRNVRMGPADAAPSAIRIHAVHTHVNGFWDA